MAKLLSSITDCTTPTMSPPAIAMIIPGINIRIGAKNILNINLIGTPIEYKPNNTIHNPII